MLGVGMALPVLLLALFPALLKRLPKPGAWMETFKQVLAFPLYATVAWLAWVLGAQAGNDAVLALLAGARAHRDGRVDVRALGALGEPVALRLSPRSSSRSASPWRGPARAPARAPTPLAARERASCAWQEWSPEKVAELVAAGKPVFVDFTAAWCVTCQVNKRVALHNDARGQSLRRDRNVATLRADWTRHDPRITAGARRPRAQRRPGLRALRCRGRMRRGCFPKCSPRPSSWTKSRVPADKLAPSSRSA